MSGPVCPKCNSILEQAEDTGVWFCPGCAKGNPFTARKENISWVKDYASDEDLWFPPAFDEVPSPIAFDYMRLKEMLEKGRVYGSLLLLKDNFEVLTKYVSSIWLSWARHEGLHHGEFSEVFRFLFENSLSFGSWMGILEEFEKKANDFSMPRFFSEEVLKALKGVPGWRNKHIGHGALAWEEDEELKGEFFENLKLLKKALMELHEWHKAYRLFCKSLGVEFTGHGNIRIHHQSQSARLHKEEIFPLVLKRDDGQELELMPFVRLQKCRICSYQDIFFLDAIQKSKVYLLDYGFGHKMSRAFNMEKPAFLGLEPKGASAIVPVSEGATVKDPLVQSEIRKFLENISLRDFKNPVYLRDWLKDSMQEHGRGVFLLRMGAGMGKSVFVRALYENKKGKMRAPDLHVVKFHINAFYRYKKEAFVFELDELINRDASGNRLVEPLQKDLPSLPVESEDLGSAFSRWLNEWVDIHKKYSHKSGVLVCIDGLDEIPVSERNEASILSYLPKVEDLSEDAFVLVTCRVKEETPQWINERLAGASVTNELEVTPEHQKNVELLKGYVRSVLKDIGPSHDLCSQILEKGQRRFLYVGHISRLLQEGQLKQKDIKDLPSGSKLHEFHLKALEKLYPSSFFNRLKGLLVTLSLCPEPLTQEELPYLIFEEDLSLSVLIMFKDLQGLLSSINTPRGRVISLAHDEIAQTIRALWKENVSNHARAIVSQFIEDLRDGSKEPGVIYVAANFLELWKKSRIVLEPLDISKSLLNFAFGLDDGRLIAEHLIMKIKIYTQVIILFKDIKLILDPRGNWTPEMNYGLASAYNNRGNAWRSKGEPDKAIEDLNKAIQIWKKLKNELKPEGNWTPKMRNNLAGAYNNRGNAWRSKGEPDKAIEDLNKAIQIWKKLKNELKPEGNWTPEMRNDLAGAYNIRGLAWSSKGEPDKAIEDYNKAIQIWKKLKNELEPEGNWTPEMRNDLAGAYNNRGNTWIFKGEPDKAIEDLNKGIQIGKKLKNELEPEGNWTPEMRNSLARAYSIRGLAWGSKGEPDKAIEDLNKAIEILELLKDDLKLLGKWTPNRRINLATAYFFTALALLTLKKLEKCHSFLSKTAQLLNKGHMKAIAAAQDFLSETTKLLNDIDLFINFLYPMIFFLKHPNKIASHLKHFEEKYSDNPEESLIVIRLFLNDCASAAKDPELRQKLLEMWRVSSFDEARAIAEDVLQTETGNSHQKLIKFYLNEILHTLFNMPQEYQDAVRSWINEKVAT